MFGYFFVELVNRTSVKVVLDLVIHGTWKPLFGLQSFRISPLIISFFSPEIALAAHLFLIPKSSLVNYTELKLFLLSCNWIYIHSSGKQISDNSE